MCLLSTQIFTMADSISAMPNEIATWLNLQTEAFRDILFITEFPPIPKATPLHKTIVSVGLESAEISDYFVENSEGVLVPDEYCRLAKLKIRFSIYVPYSSGGTACHEAFTKIVDCLNFKSDLNLIQSTCQPISADRETDAFVMKSFIDIEAQFCPADSSEIQYESFLPKTFFCNSHLQNSKIHVTEEDKARWNEKTVTGVYFGTDTSSQSITLGFKPAAVFVAPVSLPPYYIDSDSTHYCLCATAIPNYSTAGIKITAKGFTVMQNSAQNFANTVVKLNKLGLDYMYIAFKR